MFRALSTRWPARSWTSGAIPPILRPGCIGSGRAVLRDLRANSFFTMLRTWLHGELVGVDDYGNRYYRERGYRDRRAPGWRTERRWVVFSRDADPTRVPTGWVGWLHRRFEKPPSEQPLPAPRLGEGAAAESDRHARGLPAARRDRARRPPRPGDRRLRGLAAGVAFVPSCRWRVLSAAHSIDVLPHRAQRVVFRPQCLIGRGGAASYVARS